MKRPIRVQEEDKCGQKSADEVYDTTVLKQLYLFGVIGNGCVLRQL
jgi:hypothetical protein